MGAEEDGVGRTRDSAEVSVRGSGGVDVGESIGECSQLEFLEAIELGEDASGVEIARSLNLHRLDLFHCLSAWIISASNHPPLSLHETSRVPSSGKAAASFLMACGETPLPPELRGFLRSIMSTRIVSTSCLG